MRLERVDATEAAAIVAGNLGDREAAPGWPHADTAPGLSFASSGGSDFLIIDDDGRVAGECGTKAPPDGAGMVEIGYGLGARSRGQGLGHRAVAALVDEVSSWPEVRRIEAEVAEVNTPSRRVVERLGFTEIGEPATGYTRYQLPVGAAKSEPDD